MSWTGSTNDELGPRHAVHRGPTRRGPKAPERGGVLTGVWPPATSVHESSPAGEQQREGSTGSSARAVVWLPDNGGGNSGGGGLGDSGARAMEEGK
jgi:hypothetical protein